IVVCPLRSGGGTRVKLVEAAAFGRAIVSSAIGAEGLALKHGHNALIRDSDADVAEACLRLLRDDALAADLGARAHEMACSHYDAAVVVPAIGAELHAAVLASTKAIDAP